MAVHYVWSSTRAYLRSLYVRKCSVISTKQLLHLFCLDGEFSSAVNLTVLLTYDQCAEATSSGRLDGLIVVQQERTAGICVVAACIPQIHEADDLRQQI